MKYGRKDPLDFTRCAFLLLEACSPEAEFLDVIGTKVLRVFLLAMHSHLYSFALRFIFLQTHAISYSFYSSVTDCTL